jgi:hypothetical protein
MAAMWTKLLVSQPLVDDRDIAGLYQKQRVRELSTALGTKGRGEAKLDARWRIVPELPLRDATWKSRDKKWSLVDTNAGSA